MTLARQVADCMMANDQFSSLLGFELLEATEQYCLMGLTLEAKHLNGHGTCHGGVYFSLADTTFAHLCNADNHVTVAQMCQISFLHPAHAQDRLLARAECVGLSGRSGVYDILIHREGDGQLMAVFRGNSRTIKGNVIAQKGDD